MSEPNRTDNDLLKRADERERRTTDAFGKRIADGTRNTIDIPAAYDFNPERLRLYINGTRTEPADAGAKFSDAEGHFKLTPASGDTLEISTAERPRYIVGYDAQLSTAARIPGGLGSGDTYKVGGRDRQSSENLAYFEINGDAENRIVIEKEGTEIVTEAFTFPDNVDITKPIRFEIQYNSYFVGRYDFTLSYTDSSVEDGSSQQNVSVGELAVDDEFSTGECNYHIFQEIDVTSSDVELRAGSFAFAVLGDVEETTRTKGSRLTGLSYGGSGDYEPVAAVRVDPSRGNIYSQFKTVDVFPDGGSGELLVIVLEPDETDASGFSPPPGHNPNNSIVEQTTSVTTFTDQDGNSVTSDPNPSGYQVGFDTFESSGSGSKTRNATSDRVENKRPLYEDDVAVFLYKADTATARTVDVTYFIEQDW